MKEICDKYNYARDIDGIPALKRWLRLSVIEASHANIEAL
jgi:hypothetical protein